MCNVCSRLHNEACDPAAGFDEEMVHPEQRQIFASEPKVPANIQALEAEFKRASILQENFKGTECESHYNMKKSGAEALFEKAMKEWKLKVAERKERKQNEIRRLYSLGRFGDPLEIRRLLFHLSACLLDADDFREIVFAINSYSGIHKTYICCFFYPPARS